jgi:hypothetical protein
MSQGFEAITALIGAAVALLGYIAVVVRRIRKVLARWEQLMREHQQLLEVAHWHEYGEVYPLIPVPQGPRHRRARY